MPTFLRVLAVVCFVAVTASVGACSGTEEPAATSAPAGPAGAGDAETHIDPDELGAFRVTSPAFAPGSTIPTKYTCDGEGVSPPLQWNAVPDGTQSLALVVVDPDAPRPGGFTHWVLVGMDPPGGGLGEGTTEGIAGRNDAGTKGWTGPCPPSGTHSYVFTLFAFDHYADFGGDPTLAAIEAEPGVTGTATLTGTYR